MISFYRRIGAGVVYCFGDGQFGQLGMKIHTSSSFLSTPCQISMPNQEHVVELDCGVAHTAAVTGVYLF